MASVYDIADYIVTHSAAAERKRREGLERVVFDLWWWSTLNELRLFKRTRRFVGKRLVQKLDRQFGETHGRGAPDARVLLSTRPSYGCRARTGVRKNCDLRRDV